jgi:hypothetical protein
MVAMRIIAAACCGAAIGFVSGSMGFGPDHWQYWAATLPLSMAQGIAWGLM